MIINDKRFLKKSILCKPLGQINKEMVTFLDQLVQPGWNQGVKRETYYLIDLDNLFRFPSQINGRIIDVFVNYVSQCMNAGINYLMIKF